MSLFAMNMPETHTELVEWLEQHLVGLNLASLVAELTAVHGRTNDGQSLGDLLGSHIPDVIENGLTILDTKQVRSLIRHPSRLLDLQELVLAAGSQHWQKRMTDTVDDQFERIADTGWRRVKLAIRPPAGTFDHLGVSKGSSLDTITGDSPTQVAVPTVRFADHLPKQNSRTNSRFTWRTVLTSAALVMLGVLGLQQAGVLQLPADREQQLARNDSPAPATPPVAAPGWGWDKPGALPNDGPADAYFVQLADAANDWFKKRPEDATSVKQRITQFRDGCSTLIEASHEPLAVEDRQWLVEKCRAWRDKLDEQLAAIDAGTDPLTVRESADEIVNKLMTALRTRADEVAV